MEPRTEPRFETDLAAVVEVIRDKTYTLNGRITDVSGLGFRIETAEALAVGETIRLTANNYQMLARVCHCKQSDSGFSIGVERVDPWEQMVATAAAMPTAIAGAQPVLGRPVLKNPVGYLRAAALRGLFESARSKSKQTNYQAAFIVAGSVALAAWAGGSVVWNSVSHRLSGTATSKVVAAQPLPVRPSTGPGASPLKTDTANSHVAGTKTAPATQPVPLANANATTVAVAALPVKPTTVASPAPSKKDTVKVHATGTPTPTTPLARLANSTASSGVGSAQSISIRASDRSWVTACADGAMVLSKLFNKGDVGEVHFARQAMIRSGNAGATELAVGNQPFGPMGAWGEVKTIAATPAGHQYVTAAPTPNCKFELTSQSLAAAR
jgi:hypothetical protein